MERQKEPNKIERAVTGAVSARGRRGRHLAPARAGSASGRPLNGSVSSHAVHSPLSENHSVILVVAASIRVFVGIPIWITLAVLLIGWPLGSTLITIDDDLPGGWSNPDGKFVPEWRTLWWWADLLLVRGALVAAAFVADEALAVHFAALTLAAAVLMAGTGIPLFLRGLRKEMAHAG